MKLIFNSTKNRFEAFSTFDEKHISKNAGFSWDSVGKVWVTSAPAKALKLKEYADVATLLKIEELTKAENELLSKSLAIDSSIAIPAPTGLSYLPYQKAGIEFASLRQNCLIADEMGLGKEQSVDSLVLTPSGYKRLGSIKVGDKIIGGSTGRTQTVTGVFPQGLKDLYRITFCDMTSTLCGADHLWNVRDANMFYRDKGWKTLATKDLLAGKLTISKAQCPKWEIPLAPVVNFERGPKLIVHPYLLGVLLGNGGMLSGLRVSTIHKQQLDLIYPYLPEGLEIWGPFPSDPNCYYISTRKKGGINPLIEDLRTIGVYGKRDFEKAIPNQYLYASPQNRLELLQGLMDTDGGTIKARSRFSSSSEALADGVMFIVRSLGGMTRKIVIPPYGHGKLTTYQVIVRLPGKELFKLEYHKARYEQSKTRDRRTIKSITLEKTGEAVCISVDDPNQLYLTNDFIVTHNTIQALGLINFDSSIRRALIICPAGLRLNWEKESRKWLVRKPDIFRAGKKGLPSFTEGILVLGYEEATKYASVLGAGWDLICCDEAHYLKNPKAKRTKAILGIPAARWVLLTGTPILNRPVELFSLLQKVDPHGLGAEWFSYVKRYCAAFKDKWGWKVDGASNLDELNFKLRTGGMIRREKREVLKELPDKRRSLIPLEPTPEAARIIKEEKRKSLERVKALRKAKALERKDKVAFASDIEQLKGNANHIEFVEMARIRHELALSKIDQVVEYAADALASEPVIVFAHHLDVIQALASALADKGFKVAKVVGGGGADARNAIVDSFQEGELDVVVCGIKAAAEGLNLTRASHTIFAELDWSHGKIDQAEDRCHRIGQKNAVVADWLVLEGSLEAHIAKTAVKKRRDADEALGAGMTIANVVPDIEAPAPLFSDADFEAAKAREEESKKAEAAEIVLEAEIARFGHLEGNFALDTEDGVETYWVRPDLRTKKQSIWKVDDRSEVLSILQCIAADPAKAQRLYGSHTGKCYKCRRELQDDISRFLGVGPDCGREEHKQYQELAKVAADFAEYWQEAA